MNIQHSSSVGDIAIPELATSTVAPEAAPAVYQAPAIESVVTFDNLQREVFYAGSPMTDPGNPIP